MASETLQRLTIVTVLLVNAISTILGQCPQDQTQAQDIICTVNRNALLPSPAVALVHCETDQPGNFLLKQRDAENVENTKWVADQKACFFRQGESCKHMFIRIDSPPTTQQQIHVCRFHSIISVCTCVDLAEPTPSTTISTDLPTTTIPSTDPPTTTMLSTGPPSTTDPSTTTQSSTTTPKDPSIDNNKGGLTEQNAGFVSVAAVCIAFIIVLNIVLAVTCWRKRKTKTVMMTKEDIENSSSM